MGVIAHLLLISALTGAVLVDQSSTEPRRSRGYTLRTLDGHTTSLDAFRGKVVLLAFINTECPHCQRVSEMLNRLQSAYGEEALRVIAVAINDDAEKLVPPFVERFGISFPVGTDSKANARTYLGIPETGIVLVPALAVIDDSGNIHAEYGGDNPAVDDEEMLRVTLDTLTGRHATETSARRRN